MFNTSNNIAGHYFLSTVLNKKEDDRPIERKRRNSDSVLCVKSDENEMTFSLLKMKEAEIIFQQEIIESLVIDISRKSEDKLEEASDLTTTENKPLEEMDEGRSAGENNMIIIFFFVLGGEKKAIKQICLEEYH